MIKKSKGLCTTFILIAMVFNLTGCSGSSSEASVNESLENSTSEKVTSNEEEKLTPEISSPAKDAIKIEDLDWNVKESVMDGERFVSFDYTNKSSYTILDVEMNFVQKENVTAEQLSVFDKLKSDGEWTDEEVKEIYILGYNRKCAEPGETVSDSPCVINGTYTVVENMAQYQLMEPDMVSIAFIGKDGKGYTTYYDFKTQSYGESSDGALDLHKWSESKISSLLPKADYTAVNVSTDDEDRFFFYAYGVSKEEFENYVNEVKAKGFTKVDYEGNNSYRATNADGIEADINYNAVEETMTGCVEAE